MRAKDRVLGALQSGDCYYCSMDRRRFLHCLAQGASAIAAAGVASSSFSARGQTLQVSKVARALPWRGADLSFLPQMEATGAIYRDAVGQPQDCMRLLAAAGINLVRLRLWVQPADGWCDLARTIAMARRARALGLGVLLDLHYSDSWADPGQQTIPQSWAGLSFTALADRVRAYTRDVLIACGEAGVLPSAVQLGNEITDGLLWPHGRISQGGWNNFAALLRAARQGVDDACSTHRRPRVVIHIDRGGDVGGATWFFDNLSSRGVAFDVCGLSYYPWWHGSLAQCQATLSTMATRYRKPVLIAETAYPWTLGWNDNTNNLVGLPGQLQPGFAATPAGQSQFARAMVEMVSSLPSQLGQGVCWWAPDWISTTSGSAWENLSWFDFAGRLLPSAGAMGQAVAIS